MNTIAVSYVKDDGILHNARPDKTAWAWAQGMWCGCTLSPTMHVLVGWDGLIHKAYDSADDSPAGWWTAE